MRANGQRTLYTPQFFVSGAEIRPRTGLGKEVRRVNRTPSGAEIRVDAQLVSAGTLGIRAEAKARSSGAPLALYVALAQSGLVSHITRGENAGATLQHDHVVRQWIGPVPLGPEGATARRAIALPTKWNTARLQLAAFVEDTLTGRVLQAVAGHCPVP